MPYLNQGEFYSEFGTFDVKITLPKDYKVMATGDLPLPNEYKISLNDQFTIILSGSKESIFDLSVKLDGCLLYTSPSPRDRG